MFRKILSITQYTFLLITLPLFSMDPNAVLKLKNDLSQENQSLKTSGIPTFAAARSNYKQMPDKPEVSLPNMANIKPGVEEDDTILSDALVNELEKYHLMPDGKTFYLIWCGLPHFPAIENTLLDLDIDPSIYTDASAAEVATDSVYKRYIAVYKYFWDQLRNERLKLAEKQPKGFALLVNSHMLQDEENRIKTILPSVNHLKNLDIEKVVFGLETYFNYGIPNPSNSKYQDFFSSGPIHNYVKQLFDSGFAVSVIGFDYRYINKEQSEHLRQSASLSNPIAEMSIVPIPKTIYRPPSPVKNLGTSIIQKTYSYLISFDKKTGTISAVGSNYNKKNPTDSEIREFINNIYEANIPLTPEEKINLDKYMNNE